MWVTQCCDAQEGLVLMGSLCSGSLSWNGVCTCTNIGFGISHCTYDGTDCGEDSAHAQTSVLVFLCAHCTYDGTDCGEDSAHAQTSVLVFLCAHCTYDGTDCGED
jgi:hypothetical protein